MAQVFWGTGPHFPNVKCNLTVQQAVDVELVVTGCIPPQRSLLVHGEVNVPKAYPPPLRYARCFAPGLKNQGRTHYQGAGQEVSPHLSDKPTYALRCPVA